MYKVHNGLVPTAVKEKFIASSSVHNEFIAAAVLHETPPMITL